METMDNAEIESRYDLMQIKESIFINTALQFDSIEIKSRIMSIKHLRYWRNDL